MQMVRGYEESDSKRCLQFLHQLLIKSDQLSRRVDALVQQVNFDKFSVYGSDIFSLILNPGSSRLLESAQLV